NSTTNSVDIDNSTISATSGGGIVIQNSGAITVNNTTLKVDGANPVAKHGMVGGYIRIGNSSASSINLVNDVIRASGVANGDLGGLITIVSDAGLDVATGLRRQSGDIYISDTTINADGASGGSGGIVYIANGDPANPVDHAFNSSVTVDATSSISA